MGKKNKRVISSQNAIKGKVPCNTENPDSWLSKRPSWRFEKVDKGFDWNLFSANNLSEILEKLVDFERMTWGDVLKKTHDNGKSSNHFISPDKMIKKAQDRLNQLNLNEFSENIFSLRLNNINRLFGILTDGIFYILWYDNDHQICPSPKKHT